MQSKGLSRVFSNTTVQKHQLCSAFFIGTTLASTHDYWKNHSLTRWTFVDKVMSLLFNMLSRLVIAFLPRSKILLISSLPFVISPSAVILEPRKIKSATVSTVSPSVCHEVWVSSTFKVQVIFKTLPSFALGLFTFPLGIHTASLSAKSL